MSFDGVGFGGCGAKEEHREREENEIGNLFWLIFLSINHDKSHESVAISFNVMKIFDYFTARISAPALVKYDSINLYLCNISKPQQYLVGI